MRVVALSLFARLGIGARLAYFFSMDQNLCRPPLSCPKFDRSLPATTAATPATFDFIYPQVVRRQHMAIAASGGYGRALAYAIPGKAHHLGFGCFKARPRYQLGSP